MVIIKNLSFGRFFIKLQSKELQLMRWAKYYQVQPLSLRRHILVIPSQRFAGKCITELYLHTNRSSSQEASYRKRL